MRVIEREKERVNIYKSLSILTSFNTRGVIKGDKILLSR